VADAFRVIGTLIVFVVLIALVVWPLRTVLQSNKVRGAWKLVWIGLWLVAFMLGGLVSSALMAAARHFGSSILMALMPIAGLGPIWGVFILFKARTHNRPNLASRAESRAFAFGKQIRRLLGPSKST